MRRSRFSTRRVSACRENRLVETFIVTGLLILALFAGAQKGKVTRNRAISSL